jgi:hypothetical protein
MRLARLALLGAVIALAGCGIVAVEGQPDAAQIPGGPLTAVGGDAVGPITAVGSGRTLGIGWRYAVYDTADGVCTQLEMSTVTSGGCGPGPLLSDGSIFGGAGSGGSDPDAASAFPTPVHGIVGSRVAEVWIVTASGERFPTTLMSLASAGHDAQAFVGFVPAGQTAASVVATDAAGDELETFDLS